MRCFFLFVSFFILHTVSGQGGWTIIKEGKFKRVYYQSDLSVFSDMHFEDAMLFGSGKILLRHHANWWMADSSGQMISLNADYMYKDHRGNVFAGKNGKYRLQALFQNGEFTEINSVWCDSIYVSGHDGFFIYRNGDFCNLMDDSGNSILDADVDSVRKIEEGFVLYKSRQTCFFPLSYAKTGKESIKAERIVQGKNKQLIRINAVDHIWCEEMLVPLGFPVKDPQYASGDLVLSGDGNLLTKKGGVISEEVNAVGRINDGLLYFEKQKKFGMIRPDGKILFPADYDKILFSPCKMYSVFLRKKEGEWILLDVHGKIAVRATDVQLRDEIIAITTTAETVLMNTKGKEIHRGKGIRFFTPEDFSHEGLFLNQVLAVETNDSLYLYDKINTEKIISGAFRFMFYTGGLYGFTDSKEVFVYSEKGTRFFPGRSIGLVSYFDNGVFLFDFQNEKIVLNSSGKQLGLSWKEVYPLINGHFVASDGEKNYVMDEQGTIRHRADTLVLMDRSAVALRNRGEQEWKIYLASEQRMFQHTCTQIEAYQTGTQFYAPYQYRGITNDDTLYFTTDEFGNFDYIDRGLRNAVTYPVLGPGNGPRVLFYSSGNASRSVQYPANYISNAIVQNKQNDTCIYSNQLLLPESSIGLSFEKKQYLPDGISELKIRLASVLENENEDPEVVFRYVSLNHPDYFALDQRLTDHYFIPSPLIAKQNGKWGVIALNRKILLSFEWDELHYFRSGNEDRFIARKGDDIRIFDENFTELLSFKGDFLMPVYSKNTFEALAFVVNAGGEMKLSENKLDSACPVKDSAETANAYPVGGVFYCYIVSENKPGNDSDRIVIQNAEKQILFDSGKKQYWSHLLLVEEQSDLLLFKKKNLSRVLLR